MNTDADPLRQLGHDHATRGRFVEAVAAVRESFAKTVVTPHDRLTLSSMLVGAKKFDEAMIEIRLAMDGADAYNELAWSRFSTVDKLYWRCNLYNAICRAAAFVAQWQPDAERETECRRLSKEWRIVESDPEPHLQREPSLVAETRAAIS